MLVVYVGDELRSVPLQCTVLWCSACSSYFVGVSTDACFHDGSLYQQKDVIDPEKFVWISDVKNFGIDQLLFFTAQM